MKIICGILAAGALVVASGCHEWNRDRDGYHNDGGSRGRDDRRGDGAIYRDRRSDRRDWDWGRN